MRNANANQNRYTRKQEQRRKVDSIISTSGVEHFCRQHPSESEAHHLIQAVKSNKVAEFGLVKLSKFNLNCLVNVNDVVGDSNSVSTLLDFAVLTKRDKIAIALLRAGADVITDDSQCSLYLRQKRCSLQYIVWMLRFAQSHCILFGKCVKCSKSDTKSVQFNSCGHTLCLTCFWNSIDALDGLHMRLSQSTDEKPTVIWPELLNCTVYCPHCNQQQHDVDLSPAPRSQTNKSRIRLLALSPDECKGSSYALWQALPELPPLCSGSSGRSQVKDRVDCAMHPSEIAQVAMGATRAQRQEELVKAVVVADLRRVAALVEAGVHIDAADEYGMTALMIAVWLRHVAVCRLLLAAGADKSLCDALGNTALDIAASAGHSDRTRELTPDEMLGDSLFSFSSLQDIAATVANDAESILFNGEWKMTSESKISSGLCALYPRVFTPSATQTADENASLPIITTLIPRYDCQSEYAEEFWSRCPVQGAETGAFCVDGCFSQAFLLSLTDVHSRLTVAPSEKTHCASRSYFCDVHSRFTGVLESVIRSAGRTALCSDSSGTEHDAQLNVTVFPQMRFLHYTQEGSALAPHVDLSHRNVQDQRVKSTHTVILYLTDCAVGGGETVLLRNLRCKNDAKTAVVLDANFSGLRSNEVAAVSPKFGRLLIFPHHCPHEGRAILHSEPKLLLRGEACISL